MLALCLVSISGCAPVPLCCRDDSVAAELLDRTAHAAAAYVPPGQMVVPPDVVLDDGVDVDEAISLALTNNAAFHAALAQLDMACGDVVQAGLLTNPSLLTLVPVGVKQWEWTLYVPIESFLLRPQRVASARGDYQRIANDLVQNGLTLVRDVRVAHTDLALATEQARLAEEAAEIRRGIADLTEKRLERGEISELETMAARVDALNADASVALREQDMPIAGSRLATLVGLPFEADNIRAETLIAPELPEIAVDRLIEQALASRPDLRAADWLVQAAAWRASLARGQFLRLDALADANSDGEKGYEVGPGLRLDIPIFNRNEGGIIRADAELNQALRNRDAIRDRIVEQVRAAAAQVRQASENLTIVQHRVLPSLKEAVAMALKGYEDGGAAYLLVLQTTTLYLDARSRELDQTAALCRAHADLELAVGLKLAAPRPVLTPLEPVVTEGASGDPTR